ncbi:MAG TPA: type II secretion system protein [Patescibacteria group bacterium]|nr:type II secretion system protein [Patescibacteria group bacterium]
MIKRQAYTLIELLVVIAIILMLTVFGLPMFTKYQQVTEFNQKTEEIKELFNSAYAMASNPQNTQVYSYRIDYDQTNSKYSLVSCTPVGADSCSTKTIISEVILYSNETIQVPQGTPPTGSIFECPTAISGGRIAICAPNVAMQPFSFRDGRDSVGRKATFILTADPFRIDVTTLDL